MRKSGAFGDAEHITNPNFRAHQPASRALVSQISIKSVATDRRQLKYIDRVPKRKSVGGLADENLKDPQARDMARSQLVTSDMAARVLQELDTAIEYQAKHPQILTPMYGESFTPSATMAAGSEAPERDRRRDGQALGSGSKAGPSAFNYDPSAADTTWASSVALGGNVGGGGGRGPSNQEFVTAAGGVVVTGPHTDALANNTWASSVALGGNVGGGGGRGPSNRLSAKARKAENEVKGLRRSQRIQERTQRSEAEAVDKA